MREVKIGCIGKTLKHSFSKQLHHYLSPDFEYSLWELPDKQSFDSFMIKKDFSGINVTIPYKKDVISYLDGLTETAEKIGAVNTVYIKDGKWFGDNTDYIGMKSLINRNNIDIFGKKVLILGTGGTSETALYVCRDMGAKAVKRVSRTPCDKDKNIITYETAYKEYSDADVIINSTPVGMYPNIYSTPVDISEFPNLSGVVDCIYNPIRTNLILDAQEKNIKTASGLYMLIKQGAAASEIFLNRQYEEDTVNRILKQTLMKNDNIVLIGMPGCGKTTIAKKLSEKYNKKLIDTDELLCQKFKTSIKEYFDNHSELEFRREESDLICNTLSKETDCVIATGGGSVLNRDNVRALKRNGKLIYISKSVDYLVFSDSRPLSSNREMLENLYKARLPIYTEAADITVLADGMNLSEAVNSISKKYEEMYE